MTTNSPLDATMLDADELDWDGWRATIGYGKGAITAYRCDVPAQVGVSRIPESSFAGRPGPLLAAEVAIETTGPAFFPSWATGDNSALVATDTMKNFTLHRAATYPGTTVEGLAAYVGRALLAEYADMARVRITGRHLPFAPSGPTGLGFQRLARPGLRTTLSVERATQGSEVTAVMCGLDELRFVRLGGSSFAGFPRDAYTTLPETSDRPLEIGVSVRWWYGDPADASGEDLAAWVPAEAIEDLIGVLVDRVASRSIQQLLTVFARTILERYPSVSRVWLEGENRVWSQPALPPPPGGATVHSAAQPAHGVVRVALARGASRQEVA
jgi:urate oxidase/2-oxo-4-hydroxy-4-carboxy-5-ureidoimidazoline decarboxylase